MEYKKNKRKLFKRIGAIVCALALTIVAFVVPFSAKFSPKINSNNLVASADEVVNYYSFHASDFYTVSIYYRDDAASQFYTVLFSCDFEQTSNGILLNPSFYNVNISGTNFELQSNDFYHVYNDGSFYGDSNYVYDGFFTLTDSGVYRFLAGASQYAILSFENYFNGSIYIDDGFNCNVYKVVLSLNNVGYRTDSSSYSYLHIEYYDVENRKLGFEFYCPSNYVFNTRTYYLVSPDSFSDQQVYQNGYTDGNLAGYSKGENDGYNNGYAVGQTIGYNNGYSAGVNAANEYTFFSLVSAVIDAPIQAFMGLFNFELLGINLAGFFTGLLTLAFIITIVRLVMP